MIQLTKIGKYAIITILSQIMNADGVSHPKEVEFMDKVFADLDISIDELEDMSDIDYIQAQSVFCVMSDEKKNFAHSLFVSMAKVDGYVHPLESALIERLFMEI